jgi:DNA-binding CsgD family transcriptional regulator
LTEPLSGWSLVGRHEELALCASCLAGDRCRGVVVVGAAGVGKTRLVMEALATATGLGRVTARVTATESARTIPLGALAHLLPAGLARAPTTFDVLRRARVAFAERSRPEPLVLLVDDAHLLDPASAMLVHQLVVDRSAVGLVTVRSGESVPDAVTALWKDRGCAFLELQPLSRDETRLLLESVLDGPLEGRTEHLLWNASRGVPLVLRELVLDRLDRGVLAERLGLWRWRGELAVGHRLRELVAARIADLDENAREALELVALGEPLPPSWLPVPGAVDALVRRGIIEAVRAGRRLELRFAHPLQGEVVRSEIPVTRAAVLQGKLADALEAAGARRNGDLLRLATWRLESGGAVASDLFVAAAEQAEFSFAPALAERLARAAEAAGGGVPARFAAARAIVAQGRFEQAERELAVLAVEATTDAERAMIIETRARLLAGPLGRGSEAAEVVAAGRSAAEDPSSRAKLALAEGWILFRLGGPRQAVAAVRASIDDPAVDPLGRASAAVFCVQMLAQAGWPTQALTLADTQLAGLRAADIPPSLRAQAAFSETIALLSAGRLAAAEATALELYEAVVESEQIELVGRAAWLCGVVLLCRGAIETSRRFLRESVEVLEEVDPRGFLPFALAMLAQAAGHGGDAEETAAAVAAAEATAPAGEWFFTPSLETGRAWKSAAEGALSEARRSARLGGELSRAQGQLSSAFLNLHDLVRFGTPDQAVAPLAELAREVEGDWVQACAEHAAALAARDAPALQRVARTFEDLGALLFAAEASSEAAAAFRDGGREASARACAAHARALLARCPGARRPALRAAVDSDELTAREREIAALAARGHSNREIAARLVISVRTVENQLQRAYQKLGITSRSELADVLALEPSAEPRPLEVE